MGNIYSVIFNILASGFTYPSSENTDKKFMGAIKALCEDLGIKSFDDNPDINELSEAYTRLFINNPTGQTAPLYASVYGSGDGLVMQHEEEEARRFYNVAGLVPKFDQEPADFLPTELYFVSELIKTSEYILLSEFLEHLTKWFPRFEKRVLSLNPHPYYAALVKTTSVVINNICQEVMNETA